MGELFKNTLAEFYLPPLTSESVGIEASTKPFKILIMYLDYSFTGLL